MTLPVSPRDAIRFCVWASAVVDAKDESERAANELKEAQAAFDAIGIDDDMPPAVPKRVEVAKVALETAEKIEKLTQTQADSASPETVYLLRPLDFRTKVLFERDVQKDKGWHLKISDLFEAVEMAVEDGYIEAPQGLLDEVREEIRDGHQRAQFSEDIGPRWDEFWQAAFATNAPSVVAYHAESMSRQALRQYHAVRYGLRGIEGGTSDFKRTDGVVSDATMASIPPGDLMPLGRKIMNLIYVPETARKN